ncbi:MAG: Gfo/Idh/MocA family oxidoreductase [Paenibacillaceae bacterium]|uniref:Gfo/Idh/MocA family oxidoreductase n=1 Tax=Paenibacillus mellifer TaxID=2937794 RepID=A0A9X1XYU7_9BACL|nr:Gfo/Idh/MocA family oxidoreductase [Paenibacillus mellifer]MBW4839507.1 Gfo/Idh/MocA family oxidoreductase [Paenibacillaceae bacterium]MCK8487306.1 Gfo/Idh/MocA family oxidoreductase [Paenibacillus mellifer]
MMNFAIAGCGHIAYKHIEAIGKTEGARLVALCDPNPDRLAELRAITPAASYPDLGTMLAQQPDIDAVCICAPSGLHGALALEALHAGKHLVLEKPVTLDLTEAEELRQAVRFSGVKATVVHPNRYRPAMQVLQAAVAEQRFGKLSHVNMTVRWNRSQAYYDQAAWRGTKAMDGGVLLNQAIHGLDLLQWLFGPVAEVKSLTATRLKQIEAEDVAIAAIRLDSGALGVIEAATTVYGHNLEESISVFGEEGYAVISGKTANWIQHWVCASMSREETEALIRRVDEDPYGVPGHQCIIADLVQAVQEDREPEITLEDGIRAVKLALDMTGGGSGEPAYTLG